MSAASIARVLIDSPLPQLDRLFDYRIPESMRADAVPGVRVRVSLRSAGRIVDGYLIERVDSVDYEGTLSELDAVVSPVPVLTGQVYTLARRVADRAAGSANDVVRLAVPKRQVRVEKAWLSSETPDPSPINPVALAGYDTAIIDTAIALPGRLAMDAVPRVVEVDGRWVGQWALTLASIASRALHAGSVILAVPDFRDMDQLILALESILPADRIVRVDARQSNAQRYRAHLACLDGTARVIVGNRSAVYAPAAKLALIALWDDGDTLHGEPLAPYVHSRDVALIRQELEGSALLFLGHARTAEVERLVQLGWIDPLAPTRSYLPKVIPTAQQNSDDRHAQFARIPSSAWSHAKSALKDGPVLIQVARPGYAPKLVCETCSQVARCARCSGPLGLKTHASAPSCAWCGAIATQWRCAHCSGRRFHVQGQGATRTAEDLGRAFPGVPVIIADGDRTVLEVSAKPALVIATRGAEPVAEGGYLAVLLLDGERMLARESLRVGEECLRWWTHAVSLAADGAPSVLVGVGGPLAGALATWQLADFVRAELADRRFLRFPPAVRVATVTGDSDSLTRAVASVDSIAGVDVLGPSESESGTLRAIVRFDYARGAQVAAALRGEIIRNATTRRKRVPAGTGGARRPTLRVRFDDLEPFELA